MNRLAADVYAAGGAVQKVIDRVSNGHRWAWRSMAVTHYMNRNVSPWFDEGHGLTHEKFQELDPETLHDRTVRAASSAHAEGSNPPTKTGFACSRLISLWKG